MLNWLNEQVRVYRGNAASVKEYRIQLRSTKIIWYWGIYLGILVIVAMANYASIVAGADHSPASLQTSLQAYYQIVIAFLQCLILIIAPMLGASMLVSEYDLRSIELVFSSPASTKYFLVGKYMSALRQMIMLLFLSLPITAVGVTLGGATWTMVLEQYAYLAMQGAIALAIAMPIAVGTQSMVRTVAGVLAAIFLICIFCVPLVLPMLGAVMMGGAGMGTMSVPPLAGLVPFFSAFALGQSSPLFSLILPNWVFALVATIFFIKVLLLGAGSALTKAGSKETMSLRIHAIILAVVYAALMVMTVNGTPFPPSMPERLGVMFLLINVPLIPILCVLFFIAASGRAEDKKFLADKLFDFKEIIRGRPSGAMGFGLLLVGIVAFSISGALFSKGMLSKSEFLLLPSWGLAVGAFILGVGWFFSPMFDAAHAARRVIVAVVVGIMIFSYVALAMYDTAQAASYMSSGDYYQGNQMSLYNPFLPWANSFVVVVAKLVLITLLACVAYYFGEKRRRVAFEKYHSTNSLRNPA